MFSTAFLGLTLTVSALATPTHAAAFAQTGSPTDTTPSTEIHGRAMQLAKVLNSEEIIIGDAISDEKATELMLQLFGTREELLQVESDYPGIGKELAAAVLPIINRYMRLRLPDLQERQAGLYAANFTMPELGVLIDFYSSATGQKMIRSMTSRIEPKAMLQEASKSEDFKFSANSVMKDIKDTVPGILSDMNEQDEKALRGFAQSGVLPKLQALAPKTQKVAIDWMEEYADGEEKEIEKTIEATFAKHAEKESQ